MPRHLGIHLGPMEECLLRAARVLHHDDLPFEAARAAAAATTAAAATAAATAAAAAASEAAIFVARSLAAASVSLG